MINVHTYKPSLKLVVNNCENHLNDCETPINQGRAKQLNLPFDNEPLVTMVHQSMLNRDVFFHIVNIHKPKWIYDARRTPRLDTVAGSRKLAFDMFTRLHVNYLALLDNYNALTNHQVLNWRNILTEHIKVSGDIKARNMLILDDDFDYKVIKEMLIDDLENILPNNQNIDFIEYKS